MNKNRLLTALGALLTGVAVFAQPAVRVSSPDGRVTMLVENGGTLTYSVTFDGRPVITSAPMGFELCDELPLGDGMEMEVSPVTAGRDRWIPVVRNRHAVVDQHWRETTLRLREPGGERRRMDLEIRVADDGVAFRYRLYANSRVTERRILQERTGFTVPVSSRVYSAEFEGRYRSPQEEEFFRKNVTDLTEETLSGLPYLVEVESDLWAAVCEASIRDYPGFYIGGSADGRLRMRLSPLPGEGEDGVKARFEDELTTPWRVVLVGNTPGRFIETEWIRTLNPPSAIKETSWIRPGLCAWDHWWSGEIKMEMDVIKEYIDFAAAEGWPYMLVDWTWYGPYNTPEADITRPAPQVDMPEIIRYAAEKGVRIWLWLYCSDVNRNDAYKEAFPLYERWGVAGVKIDFMDRDDQQMVRWYRRIVEKAAEHHLMVDFHGAYKPDGMERTYPNLRTREGVKGNEHNKWGEGISAAHNVKLAYTRMISGPMDYTPGGFLNVEPAAYKAQTPTLVPNTRCHELAKFVVYESPFTVVCDHPRHIRGEVGEDFLQLVPTEWDDTRFLSGSPDTYVAVARREGNRWFVGILGGNEERDIDLDLSFLGTGSWKITAWTDGRKPADAAKKTQALAPGKPLRIHLAASGGYVAVIE